MKKIVALCVALFALVLASNEAFSKPIAYISKARLQRNCASTGGNWTVGDGGVYACNLNGVHVGCRRGECRAWPDSADNSSETASSRRLLEQGLLE